MLKTINGGLLVCHLPSLLHTSGTDTVVDWKLIKYTWFTVIPAISCNIGVIVGCLQSFLHVPLPYNSLLSNSIQAVYKKTQNSLLLLLMRDSSLARVITLFVTAAISDKTVGGFLIPRYAWEASLMTAWIPSTHVSTNLPSNKS